jgi:hypothetical protein
MFILHLGNRRGLLAQSVEQVTLNHWVIGSSPIRPTTRKAVLDGETKRNQVSKRLRFFVGMCHTCAKLSKLFLARYSSLTHATMECHHYV